MKIKKRRALSKTERVLIANETNFRCGYCGIDLGEKFHIDHIEPFVSPYASCKVENLMASCVPCNLFKSCLTLEQFRREVSYQAERNIKNSVNARTALRFGQIKITRSPIVFYFEKMESEWANL